MAEPNLESLIKDLYNHARQGLSEDLVAALLETAKKLPTTNEQLLAVRLSGLVTRESVSYTHLDVYKRQVYQFRQRRLLGIRCWSW